MSDARNYLFHGGLEDDVKQLGRDIDDTIIQPVVQTVLKLPENPRALAAIAVGVAFPGLGTAIGNSILGSAAATIGTTATTIFGNTLLNTALNGGNVKAGLLSAVGQELGALGKAEVAKFVDAGTIVGKTLASATEGAIRSGTMAAAFGKDPIQAIVSGGLAAGLSTAVVSTIADTFKEVPELQKLTSDDPLARASRAALGAMLTGKSGAPAFTTSLFESMVKLGSDYFKDAIRNDSDQKVIAAGDELKSVRSQLDTVGNEYQKKFETFQRTEFVTKEWERDTQYRVRLIDDEIKQIVDLYNSGNPYWAGDPRFTQSEIDGLTQKRNEIIGNWEQQLNKYNNAAAEINTIGQQYKDIEAKYATSLNKFESFVGEFQKQELANTTFVTQAINNIGKAKDLYFQARGQELPDSELDQYLPKITRTDLSAPEPEALTRLVQEVEVKKIKPDFDPEIFVKENNLKTTNPYGAFLEYGQKNGLIASQADVNAKIASEKSRLLDEAAKAVGYDSGIQIPDEVAAGIGNALDKQLGGDLTKWREKSLGSWDDINGLQLKEVERQALGEPLRIDVSGVGLIQGSDDTSIDQLRANLKDELARSKFDLPGGFRLGTAAEMLEGTGSIITLPNGQRMHVVDERGITGPAAIPDKPPSATETLNALLNASSEIVTPGIQQLITNLIEKAPKSNLPTVMPQFVQDAWENSKTPQGVSMTSFGKVLQSFNGLSTFAGINPETTPLGKFAKTMVDAGTARTADDYKAAVKQMNENYAGAKGASGMAKAIWGNFKDYPVEFLSEVVLSEALQELAPLAIGGGVGTFARGLATARGFGTEIAQKIGTKAGLAAAGISDIAESAGGSAAGAFEEAYNIATKKLGMSEADATQLALDIARKNGSFAALATATTLGMGGNALEKSILGGAGNGAMGSALDRIKDFAKTGGKVTLKEGATESGEEGLVQAHLESLLYQLDPTRDVAANIANSAILAAISGGGISGGAFAFGNSRDIFANVAQTNPQVQRIVSESTTPQEAEKALSDFGLPQSVNTEILNTKFNDQYVSNQEALNALRGTQGYVPTDTEVEQFTGRRSEQNLANDVAQYVDPRVVDQDEARRAFAEIGIADPTADEIAAYTGQRDELEAVRQIQADLGANATTTAEAEALFKNRGYTPSSEELQQFTGRIKDSEAEQKIAEYVDPRQVTKTEAEQIFKDLGYTPSSQEEIDQFVRTGQDISQQDVQKQIGDYVNPRLVDAEEVRAAYRDLGLPDPTDQDIQKLVGQYAQEELPTRAKDALDVAFFNKNQDQINKATTEIKSAIDAAQKGNTDKFADIDRSIQELKDLGLTTDDVQDIVNRSTEGVSNELKNAIDEAAQGNAEALDLFKKQMETDIGGVKEQIGEVEKGVTEKIGDVEKTILDRVGQYEQAGVDRDTALDNAIKDVAADLGTTEKNLLDQIQKVETKVGEQIAETGKTLSDQISEIEKAGADRDTALELAIDSVAKDLGVTKKEITDQMALYEQAGVDRDTALELAVGNVSKDIAKTQQDVAQEFTKLQEIIGRQQIDPSRADLDYITEMLSKGQTPDISYDVTGDRKVDEADRVALYNYIMRVPGAEGEPPEPVFKPALESRWAPTGLYGALARQQQEFQQQMEAQRQADEAAKLAEEQARKAAAAKAQQAQRRTQFMNMMGQAPDIMGQQVQVKPADLAKIGYIYDWSSIFANPAQQQLYASPFAEGGLIDPDDLIAYLRG